MLTTYERGILQGRRQVALQQLEAKFGSLSPEMLKRVEAMPPQDLAQLLLAFLKVESLKELRLED